MTNFTPNDARRLREAAEKARAGCGSGYFLLDKYELDDPDNVAYYCDAANSVPALLDINAALLKVAECAKKLRSPKTRDTEIPIALLALDETLKPFQTGGPHAIWLQPEAGKEEGDAD